MPKCAGPFSMIAAHFRKEKPGLYSDCEVIYVDDLRSLLYRLKDQRSLTKEEWTALIAGRTPELAEELFSLARQERHTWYGHDIYIRGQRGIYLFYKLLKTRLFLLRHPQKQ